MSLRFFRRRKFSTRLLACSSIVLLNACATEEVYKTQPNIPLARVEKLFHQGLKICVDGKNYKLDKTGNYYYIPAGKLVVLSSKRFRIRIGDSTILCRPEVGLVAKERLTYTLDLPPEGNNCGFIISHANINEHDIDVRDFHTLHNSCFYNDVGLVHADGPLPGQLDKPQ